MTFQRVSKHKIAYCRKSHQNEHFQLISSVILACNHIMQGRKDSSRIPTSSQSLESLKIEKF